MVVDKSTINRVKKKAKLFANKGSQIKNRVVREVDALIKLLDEIKEELVDEIEIEFSVNEYEDLLRSIDSNNCPTDNEIKSILAKEIPNDFGPSVETFISLRKKLESSR